MAVIKVNQKKSAFPELFPGDLVTVTGSSQKDPYYCILSRRDGDYFFVDLKNGDVPWSETGTLNDLFDLVKVCGYMIYKYEGTITLGNKE